MMRYWISFIVALLIIGGVGSFYIQAAAHSSPEFVLQRQFGDEQAAEGITLQASYNNNGLWQNVFIDPTGSRYELKSSILGRLKPYRDNPEIESLIDRYRGFMRGKRELNGFFEDEHYLVYAYFVVNRMINRNDYRLRASILDKQTNRTQTFEAILPNGKQYNGVYVQDVQVIGERIEIVTENYGGSAIQYRLYTHSLHGSEPLTEQPIFDETPVTDANNNKSTQLVVSSITKPSRYLVLFTHQYQKVAGDQRRPFGGQLLVYDHQTGQPVRVGSKEISELLASNSEDRVLPYLDGDTVYLVIESTGGIRVIQYDIADDRTFVRTLPVLKELGETRVKNGRLYNLVDRGVTVTDIATGNVLYQGKVALDHPEADTDVTLSLLNVGTIRVQ